MKKDDSTETQQTLTHLVQPHKKYDLKHPKQKLVTDTLINFVAEDLIPLSVVVSTWFNKLLYILDSHYHLPTRKHLSTKLLKAKYDFLKGSLKNQLKQVNCENLTVDLWTNRQIHSFLGITVHFFQFLEAGKCYVRM